ncbi:MAG: hypothetical protein KDC43_29830 [Saprospiraceae bacterium]|nr:hypothetical protein [Saprospiraceae bacterium]
MSDIIDKYFQDKKDGKKDEVGEAAEQWLKAFKTAINNAYNEAMDPSCGPHDTDDQ